MSEPAEPQSQPAEPAPKPFKPSRGFILAYTSLAVVSLAASLDAVTIGVALPAISQSINGTATEAFWAGTSFLLSSTVLMLNWVAFSSIFGRRPIMLFSCAVFGLGAILCGVSQDFTLLLIGRTIQGAGGGGFVAVVQVIITDMVPLRERAKYYALMSIVYALGSLVGPIIGGSLAQHGAWRWIFWLNLPIIGIGIVGMILFLKLQYRERAFLTKLGEIDWIGSFLFIASTTSFLIPVTWGGVTYPWSNWRTLVPLLLGLAGLVAFTVHQIWSPRVTLIPISIFTNRSTSLYFLCAFCQGVVLWSMVYYLPEYFQAVKGYTATQAGLAALPQGVTMIPSAMFVGVIVSMTGKYRWALTAGWALSTIGYGVMILLDVNTTIVAWVFIELTAGIGIGILFPAIALGIQASAPQTATAMAATLGTFFRFFGQTLGVAIGGSIFQNEMVRHLISIPSLASNASAYSISSVELIGQLREMPNDSPEAIQLRQSFADSYKTIWEVMCALCGFALLVSFFVVEYDLDQQHVTDQGFVEGGYKEKAEQIAASDSSAMNLSVEGKGEETPADKVSNKV